MAARARAGFGANLLEYSFSREGAKFARVSRGSILCQAPSLLDDIQMSADAKLDAAVGRQAGVALDEARLHLDRTAHGIDHAAEFDENAVAGALDDAPMRRGVGGIDQIAAEAAKTRKSSLFLGAGEPAGADDVGDQDRC
jgi:hypothetical protein